MTRTAVPTTQEMNQMKLPELRALYRAVTGQETKSPNRKFLLRSIETAASAARPKKTKPTGGHGRGGAPLAASPPLPAPVPESQPASPPLARVGGVPRTSLVPAGGHPHPASPMLAHGVTPASGVKVVHARSYFAPMTVEQLEAMYLATVGRPTASRNRNYLIWKIREAEGGYVRVGPRRVREPRDTRTIPLIVEKRGIEKLDEVWRTKGFASRNQFVTHAIGGALRSLGAVDAASFFALRAGADA